MLGQTVSEKMRVLALSGKAKRYKREKIQNKKKMKIYRRACLLSLSLSSCKRSERTDERERIGREQ